MHARRPVRITGPAPDGVRIRSTCTLTTPPCSLHHLLRGAAQVFVDGHTRIDGLTHNGQPYIGDGQLVRVDARFCRCRARSARRSSPAGSCPPGRSSPPSTAEDILGADWRGWPGVVSRATGGHALAVAIVLLLAAVGRRDGPDGPSPALASAPYGVTSQGAADPGAARQRDPAGAPPAPRSAGRVPRRRDRPFDHPPRPQARGERHRRRHDHRRRRELGAAAARLRHARAGRPAQLPGGARRGRVARRASSSSTASRPASSPATASATCSWPGMTDLLGSFDQAVSASARVLAVAGQVVPSTVELVELVARFPDGHEVRGETALAADGAQCERVRLDPPAPAAHPRALQAIERAELIVMGPGSLYTSTHPAAPRSRASPRRCARRPCRGSTSATCSSSRARPRATCASDHVARLYDHVGEGLVDIVVVSRNRAQYGTPVVGRSRRAAPARRAGRGRAAWPADGSTIPTGSRACSCAWPGVPASRR